MNCWQSWPQSSTELTLSQLRSPAIAGDARRFPGVRSFTSSTQLHVSASRVCVPTEPDVASDQGRGCKERGRSSVGPRKIRDSRSSTVSR